MIPKTILLVFVLAAAGAAAVPAPMVFDIAKYGAIGDGSTLNSAAIDKAIDAANRAGGGAVYFPAGTWLSGSIHLKSNVSLYLDQGSTILATSDPQAYDEPEPNQWDKYQDFGHSHFHNSLIWGEGLENVAILGTGRIYGKGLTRSQNQPRLGKGDQPEPVPQRDHKRHLDPSGRLVRHPGHGGGQPHHRQPKNRYEPRWNGHRLMPQCAYFQQQRELALRRWHLPESRLRVGLLPGC